MAQRDERARRGWTLLAGAGAVAVAWWIGAQRPDVPPPAPPPAPVVDETPSTASPIDGGTIVAMAEAPTKLGSVGFCPTEGEADSFEYEPVPSFLRRESQRLAQADGPLPVTQLLDLVAAKHFDAAIALAQAGRVSHEYPGVGAVELARAFAAKAAGRPELELEALRAARRAAPDDPTIAWHLAWRERTTLDVDEAGRALDVVLAHKPQESIARMRALLQVEGDIQRDYAHIDRGGFTLAWPKELLTAAQADALLAETQHDIADAAALTGTAARESLVIVVYPGSEEVLAVSCVPSWAGGLYDGKLRLVGVPGQPIGVDPLVLRHESLHAQLSPLLAHAPKWWHEGLAQSFAGEVPRVRGRWRLMVKNHTYIPFASLGGTFHVFEDGADAGLAYAEALGLVELMRDARGDAAVGEAVRAFQDGADTPAVLARALGEREVTGDELLDYLAKRLASTR